MAAAPPADSGLPAIAPPIVLPGPLMWEEHFAAVDWVFTSPAVPYGMLSAAIFHLADPLETLLNKLEWTALESPVVVALVLDEDPNWITLLKNPRCFVGSLMHPTALDGLMYSFSGPDTQRLAAVHIPASAFEVSTAFNVLDNAATVCLGLESLPADQVFHPYVNMGTPNMTNSACRHAVLLPIKWHMQLVREFSCGVTCKAFYDIFLAPLQAVASHPYVDVQTWWRHAAMCTMAARAQECLGLQVSTMQALSPALHANHDGWAHEQVAFILQPLMGRDKTQKQSTFCLFVFRLYCWLPPRSASVCG